MHQGDTTSRRYTYVDVKFLPLYIGNFRMLNIQEIDTNHYVILQDA